MLSASLPLSTLVAAHEGRLIGDPDGVIITDVVIDSRQIHRGCLFICVPGENVDGHDFASTAVAAGAASSSGASPESTRTRERTWGRSDEGTISISRRA